MKVFINKVIPEIGFKLLDEAGIAYTVWKEKPILDRGQAIQFCKGHDAFLSVGQAGLDADFFRECKHLKVVALHSVGFDGIDIKAATENGVPVGNTPNVLNKATAETALLLMLTVARKALYLHNKIKQGEWGASQQPTQDLGIDLAGKTLGIVGLGRIGTELAKIVTQSWGMKILYHNRTTNAEAEKELGAKKVSMDELLAGSDVVSVHTALTSETKGMFGMEQFKKMKPSAIFINTARGGVHKEDELIEALQQQIIWGAGLDVTNPEPMSKDNPLLEMENAVVFPHIGSATKETRDKMSTCAVENIIAGLKGDPLPYPVNPEVRQGK
ncbi:2-hydroxyacid dehydrogenase [Cyclobacterium qasimii]|uniref:Glyoxylate/hydroxypyruvate reductase B n=2 Tax=Cyclobacterium qasimii TaxID=1350429 RepID=S7WRR0_9BACT|nr:D-glycerate dehydrogenase [Cyclobacterium qasimii]EPR66778.1 D-isomer specific 2-hydroxyacid dehydrogenase [Cyclobacterium qasimii M12-11B]GEO21668.1 D-glycerate dehydrogenase [Cyclobacterium qasimii]